MASFKITDLTELAGGSVNDSDVLEIVDLDADQSKKVTIASLKTVFAGSGVSEGSSYTGGTADGIMFNDGGTFATSANIIYNNELIVNSNGVSGSGGGRERVATFKGTLPEILILDTTYRGFAYSLYNNQVYFRHTNTSGAYVNNVGQIQLSSGKWTIGDGTNPTGQLDVNVQLSSIIGQRINLSNGQTEDAFQINSYGNTGGDVFKVGSTGTVDISAEAASNGKQMLRLYNPNASTTQGQYVTMGIGQSGGGPTDGQFVMTRNTFIQGGGSSQDFMVVEPDSRVRLYELAIYNKTITSDGGTSPNITATNLFEMGKRGNTGDYIATSGVYNIITTPVLPSWNSGNHDFAPTSGTAEFNTFVINTSVNQTGGASGITRGLYINPTITAAADWRAIEVANGDVLFGTTSGNVGIGTTSPDAKLHTSLSTDVVGHRLDLSNGQTEDAFQINSYGNTGGDLFRVEADGNTSIVSTSNYSASLVIGGNGNSYVLRVNDNCANLGGGSLMVSGTGTSTSNLFMMTDANRAARSYQLDNGRFGITDNATIYVSNSALLELNSTTRGFLPPRMTTTERDAISSPATGLLIFNTTTKKLDYYSGTAWGQV